MIYLFSLLDERLKKERAQNKRENAKVTRISSMVLMRLWPTIFSRWRFVQGWLILPRVFTAPSDVQKKRILKIHCWWRRLLSQIPVSRKSMIRNEKTKVAYILRSIRSYTIRNSHQSYGGMLWCANLFWSRMYWISSWSEKPLVLPALRNHFRSTEWYSTWSA